MPKLSFIDQLDERQIEYAGKIAAKAKEMGIPPSLAVAIAYQESRLNPDAPRGQSGEFGIMQVMPATGKGMGFTNKELNDPEKNIEAGLKYLKQNLDAFGGDQKLATVGYNAGTDSPFFSGGELPKSTEGYVKDMKSYGVYDEDQPQKSEASGAERAAQLLFGGSEQNQTEPDAAETDEQRDARIQAVMDEQEKRQAQVLGAGVGLGVSGTKAAGAGAGAVLEAGANRIGQGFSAGMQANTPSAPTLGQQPTGPTSGEKWAAKTGYGKGAGTVQDVSSRFQRSVGQGPVSGRMDKLWGPPLEGENRQLTQRLIDRAKAAELAKIPPKVSGLDWITGKLAEMIRPVASVGSTALRYAAPPVALAYAAGEGADIAQQMRKPASEIDVPGMLIKGASAVGGGLSAFGPTQRYGIPLTAAALAAQAYRDNPNILDQKMQGASSIPLLDEMTGPLP
jgi:soluble lytic murein transglycosylase-like protein